MLYTNVMHFLYSWQVQEKGSHYFSGEVSTNGKEQVVDGFFGPFGGGVLGKCQESSFSFKLKCHLTTFSFRMFQTRNDNVVKGEKISNYVQCRHKFPQFPMNKTKFILGMPKDLKAEEMNQRKKDLLKIKKCTILWISH